MGGATLHTFYCLQQSSHAFSAMVQVFPPAAVCAKQQRRHEQEEFFIRAAAAREGASFRSADAAQVCNNAGFVEVDGMFEWSSAVAARQIVSERW